MISMFYVLFKKFLLTQGKEDVLLCFSLNGLLIYSSHLNLQFIWNLFFVYVVK